MCATYHVTIGSTSYGEIAREVSAMYEALFTYKASAWLVIPTSTYTAILLRIKTHANMTYDYGTGA